MAVVPKRLRRRTLATKLPNGRVAPLHDSQDSAARPFEVIIAAPLSLDHQHQVVVRSRLHLNRPLARQFPLVRKPRYRNRCSSASRLTLRRHLRRNLRPHQRRRQHSHRCAGQGRRRTWRGHQHRRCAAHDVAVAAGSGRSVPSQIDLVAGWHRHRPVNIGGHARLIDKRRGNNRPRLHLVANCQSGCGGVRVRCAGDRCWHRIVRGRIQRRVIRRTAGRHRIAGVDRRLWHLRLAADCRARDRAKYEE